MAQASATAPAPNAHTNPTAPAHRPAVRDRERIRRAMTAYFVLGPQDVEPLGRTVTDAVREALDGGITFLQLRAKPADAGDVLQLAREVCALLPQGEPGVDRPYLVIDDRVDVAWAARHEGLPVDGVHVGQTDLPVEHVRALLGEDAIIGLSTGSVQEATKAAQLAEYVDYVGIGPYHNTVSKADAPDGLGAERFEAVADAARPLPNCAIGGVTPADAPEIAAHHGDGLCVISYICRSASIREGARSLREAWEAAVAEAGGR